MKRNWKLDLIRSLAILLVMALHTTLFRAPHPDWLKFVGLRGGVGVDMFFVLSGWLIGGQLFRSMKRSGGLDVGNFWARRWLRTLPAYYVMLMVVCLLPCANATGKLPSMLFFAQNYTDPFPWGVTWSLCIEEHFYLLLPLLLLALRGRKRATVVVAVALLFLSPILRWMTAYADPTWTPADYQRVIYMPTHVRLDGLAFGVVMAALREYQTPLWDWMDRHAAWLAVGGLLTFVGAALPLEQVVTAYVVVPRMFVISLGVALLLPAASKVAPGALAWWQLPIIWVAEHAYALYLTHSWAFTWGINWLRRPVIEFMPEYAYPVLMTLAWVSAFVTAILLRALIEKPGLRVREWLEARRVPAAEPVL